MRGAGAGRVDASVPESHRPSPTRRTRSVRTLGFVCALASIGVLLAFSTATAEPPAADPAAALEGGKPLPDGAWSVKFPWMAKQSVMFVSDAEAERMVGFVKFDNPGIEPVGTVKLDGKGGGTGSFKVPAKEMTTGIPGRDEHMMGAQWLDGGKFPDIVYTITKLERVKPTVYRATGTWKMHGVEKPVSTLANVRFLDKLYGFDAANGIARLKTKLSLGLKDFGVTSEYVGSPSVAATWDVEVVVLGALEK